MIPLIKYKEIKDIYCIGCCSNDNDILLEIEKSIPFIEKELPGIKILVCCNDEKVNIFLDQNRIIKKSDLLNKSRNREFAYYREIKNIKLLLEESNIPYNF